MFPCSAKYLLAGNILTYINNIKTEVFQHHTANILTQIMDIPFYCSHNYSSLFYLCCILFHEWSQDIYTPFHGLSRGYQVWNKLFPFGKQVSKMPYGWGHDVKEYVLRGYNFF